MIKFRTEVEIPEFNKKMGYRQRSLMIGSCFAENTGNYLQERCLPIMINPFGILYNPLSISHCLDQIISGKIFSENDLFFANGLYHSFSHHSRYSGPDPGQMLDKINAASSESLAYLKNASHLFVTFGTSWVFQLKENGNVVSNCHKLPAATFTRKRLDVGDITETWIPLIDQIRRINPSLQVVFTVSPIRHLKDGSHENQISKSILLIAIDKIISDFGNDRTTYFPSYEIVLDELRDYRFYAADMSHPSDVALDFIREKFTKGFFDNEAHSIINEVDNIILFLKHRPFNPKDNQYMSFIENQIKKLEILQKKHPFADFEPLMRKINEKKID